MFTYWALLKYCQYAFNLSKNQDFYAFNDSISLKLLPLQSFHERSACRPDHDIFSHQICLSNSSRVRNRTANSMSKSVSHMQTSNYEEAVVSINK